MNGETEGSGAIRGDNAASASGERRRILVVKVGGSLMDKVSSVIATLKSAAQSPDCAFDKIVLVPGGGIFADEIRSMNADDETSHWLAVLAMEKFGYLISALGVPSTDSLADCIADFADADTCRGSSCCGKTLVLLPYKPMREHDPLPHSWDITSDSIAAWAASELSERLKPGFGGDCRVSLLLLKSVDGIMRRDTNTTSAINTTRTTPAPIPDTAACGAPASDAAENSEIIPEICGIREGERFEEVDPFCIPLILKSGIDGYILNARKPELLTAFILGRNFGGTHIHRHP
ncbi:amino acid kinase family protein [Methanomicrobium mobile]|uniref:amino acid kinase family protein n=1 Tax=Methanomicrobium mobile TaxID=2205 RepID=UPI0012F6602F|nr:hypothetical protein [Methanomicrobium mobile]